MASMSRCMYIMCQCGAVYHKDKVAPNWRTGLAVVELGASQLVVSGKGTCARCGNVLATGDIYRGDHDLPREHWSKINGPVEVESAATNAHEEKTSGGAAKGRFWSRLFRSPSRSRSGAGPAQNTSSAPDETGAATHLSNQPLRNAGQVQRNVSALTQKIEQPNPRDGLKQGQTPTAITQTATDKNPPADRKLSAIDISHSTGKKLDVLEAINLAHVECLNLRPIPKDIINAEFRKFVADMKSNRSFRTLFCGDIEGLLAEFPNVAPLMKFARATFQETLGWDSYCTLTPSDGGGVVSIAVHNDVINMMFPLFFWKSPTAYYAMIPTTGQRHEKLALFQKKV